MHCPHVNPWFCEGCASRRLAAELAAERALPADVALGQENVRVAVAPIALGQERFPPFEYMARAMASAEVPWPGLGAVPDAPPCGCVNGCLPGSACPCHSVSNGAVYTLDGRLLPSAPQTLHECGRRCTCPATCPMRVVGGGLRLRLEVFFSDDLSDWAVRCLDDVAAGTFVAEFSGVARRWSSLRDEMARAGEVVPERLVARTSHWRPESSFLPITGAFLRAGLSAEALGGAEDEEYALDARAQGNVARFVARAREGVGANLVPRLVNVGAGGGHVVGARFALFAKRDLARGTVLVRQ